MPDLDRKKAEHHEPIVVKPQALATHAPAASESFSVGHGENATSDAAASVLGHWAEPGTTPEVVPEGPGDDQKVDLNKPGLGSGGTLDPLKDPKQNPVPTNEFAPNATYGEVKGTVAVKGEGDAHEIDPSDVKQGSLGDCYFVAQLAAQARTNPDRIKHLIQDHGDGTYTVTLHLKDEKTGKRVPTDIVVDSQFPQKDGKVAYAKPGDVGEAGPELWAMLLEKAWAKVSGSYESIRGKKTKDSDVFAMMSGEASSNISLAGQDEVQLLDKLSKALTNGQGVSFGSKSSTDDAAVQELKDAGVVGNHAYTLMGVDLKAKTVSLRNPWGVQHLNDFTIDKLIKFFTSCKIAAK